MEPDRESPSPDSPNKDSIDSWFEENYLWLRHRITFLMQHERRNHTLDSTEVASEVYRRLRAHKTECKSRREYRILAVRVCREFLIDYARIRQAKKRGGDMERTTLADHHAIDPRGNLDILDLESLLERLKERNRRQHDVVVLRVYGGFGARECGELLGITEDTVHKHWSFAKAWLKSRVAAPGTGGTDCPPNPERECHDRRES